MADLASDLRFTLRALAGRPGFTAVAVLTLGLGIGANAAIFSVVDAVLLTPLGYEDPERLVMLRDRQPVSPRVPMSAEELVRLADDATSLAAIGALDMVDFNVLDASGVELIRGARVSRGFFELFGVRPALGRSFTEAEAEPGGAGVVVLSHAFWQARFGGEESALGRRLTMGWNASFGPLRDLGRSFTVVGVLPEGFVPPLGARDLWVPLALTAEDLAGGAHYLFPFARLRPGVELAAATTELSGLIRTLQRASDQSRQHEGEGGVTLEVVGARAAQRVRPALLALSGAVVFVLLIACANVANLLLARGTTRRQELAVRAALGASRGRLLRPLLLEALVLAALGCALGLALAAGGVAALAAWQPGNLPRVEEIAIDGRVLAFTAALGLATALLFGLLPARRALAQGLAAGLPEGSRGAGDSSGNRLRHTLVVAEVALSVVLLAGAGLLLKSFHSLRQVDLGLESERVLSFNLALPPLRYPEAHQRQAFYLRALERLGALPEVSSAAAASYLPFAYVNAASSFVVEGRPSAAEQAPTASYRQVSAGYFETLGIPLLAGELPRPEDVLDQPAVAVVNRELARRYFPGGDALGATLTLGAGPGSVRVVGLVGDVLGAGAAAGARPMIYLPMLGARSMGVVLRAHDDPESLAAAAARVIREIDPEQPISAAGPLAVQGSRRLARPRFNARLLALFAVLALLLAAVGIYSVLHFSISRRTREIGVRMALGAARGDVLRLVLAQGMGLVGVGLLLGLAASAGLTRSLESLLFGVTATDPATYAAISGLLLAVAWLAVAVPAWRAIRVEPVTALRHE